MTVRQLIERLQDYQRQATGRFLNNREIYCAEEIRERIDSFFEKAMNNLPEERERCSTISFVAETVKNLALNTRNYVKLRKGEADSLSKIFDVMDKLLEEALNDRQSIYGPSVETRMINQLLLCNIDSYNGGDARLNSQKFREALVFRSYNSLWKIINRLHAENEDLRTRGLTRAMIVTFCSTARKRRDTPDRVSGEGNYNTERGVLSRFMAMLDGKESLVPVFKYKQDGYALLPIDHPYENGVFLPDHDRVKTIRMKKKLSKR